MANKRVLVDPPPFTPLRFGLLSAAIDRTAEAPDHWRTGVTWQSHCPDADGTYDPCLVETRDDVDPTMTETDPAPEPDPKAETDTNLDVEDEQASLFLRGATPFTVYNRQDCSPVGFWERAQDLGVQALTRVESHQVERIFDDGITRNLGGAQTAYPHLRDDTGLVDDTGATLQTAAQVVTASPVDIVEGLGRIQAALADCYHGRGVIHIPAVLGAELMAHTLTIRSGAVLETLLGNRIALGTGYEGIGPSGETAPDVAWVYATGAVFYYRSDIRVNQLVDSYDREFNTVQMIAERTYVFGWDCCHLAIPVHIGGITAGGFDVGT